MNRHIKSRIINRIDSIDNWFNINPILFSGEMGVESETSLFKIGDGKHKWKDLNYSNDIKSHITMKEVGEIGITSRSIPPLNCLILPTTITKDEYPELYKIGLEEIDMGNTLYINNGNQTMTIKSPRFPVGKDEGDFDFGVLGKQGGTKEHTLNNSEIPSHTHIQNQHNHTQAEHNHTFTGTAVAAHNHTMAHTHTGPNHNHNLNSHTHTGPNHNHTVTMNAHTHSGPNHHHMIRIAHGASLHCTAANHIDPNNRSGGVGATSAHGSETPFNVGEALNIGLTPRGASRHRVDSSGTDNTSSTTSTVNSVSNSGTGATGGPSNNNTSDAGTGNTGASSTANTGNGGAFTPTGSINNQTPTINNTTPTNQNTGGGQSHNNLPPFTVVNFWVCYKSITSEPSFVKGMIIMWSGIEDEIPEGWSLCNGDNDTPDLRNRFVVGVGDTYSPGDTGGSENVTLTVQQMPTHTHTQNPHNHIFNGTTLGNHTHTFTGTAMVNHNHTQNPHTHTQNQHRHSSPMPAHTVSILNSGNWLVGFSQATPNNVWNTNYETAINNNTTPTNVAVSAGTPAGTNAQVSAGTPTGSISDTTPTNQNTGGGNAHENRPPYYALCYIMKI